MIESLRILSTLLTTRFRQPRTKEALARLQEKKLRKTMDYVSRTFDRKSLPPVITKSEFVENFQKLNILKLSYEDAMAQAHRGEPIGDIYFGLSTGTSGSRGVFMTSSEERARWAGAVIGRCLPTLVKPTKVAFFLRSDNKLYHSINRGRRLQLKHFDLDTELDIKGLNQFSPTVLMAPSYVLARLALSNRLKISPDLVIASADILDPWDETVIKARFPRVHQIYQATEGFLAASCSHGTLHLNEDSLLFERRHLDEKHFVPIITDFHRRSQAVVRFELGDVLKLGGPCSCGSPFQTIEKIDGRLDEIFQTPRRLLRGELARSVAHLPLAGVDFRFTQMSPTEFVLNVSDSADSLLMHDLAAALTKTLREAGVTDPKLQLEKTLALKLFEKRRRFICQVNS